MNTIPLRFSRNQRIKLIAFAIIVVLLLSCTLGGALQSSGEGPASDDETEVPGGGGEGEPPPDDPPVPPTVEEDEPEDEEDPTDELVFCPTEVTTWDLEVRHHFWTDAGMGLWEWEASGLLILHIDGPELVGGAVEEVISGRQFGAFADGDSSCEFEAPADVLVTVHGSCQDGVMTLNISEDWQMGTYTWICQSDDEPDIAMFNLPSFGSTVHPDLNFLLLPEGDRVELPWFGEGGGTKNWWLAPAMEPVPLAP